MAKLTMTSLKGRIYSVGESFHLTKVLTVHGEGTVCPSDLSWCQLTKLKDR